MNSTENFNRCINNAKIGEMITREILGGVPKVKYVVDVRDDKNHFREWDVDFLAIYDSGDIDFVETKTDFLSHKTHNIAYELTTSGHIGCFEKTRAKWMFYYSADKDSLTGVMYVINVKELRAYAHTITSTPIRMGDNATGHLLKIETLKEKNIIKREYKIDVC